MRKTEPVWRRSVTLSNADLTPRCPFASFFAPALGTSSSYINHFIQPDTIIPDPANPQAWNRYSYVRNNPIGFNDPTGHNADCGIGEKCKDKRDLTSWIVATAIDIAESPEMQSIRWMNKSIELAIGVATRKAFAYSKFKNLVGDGMKYDVKDVIYDELGGTIKIGDQWYEYSTAGNILYGFYGKEAGFTEFELRAGAGKAQLDDYDRDPTSGLGPCKSLLYTDCDTDDDYAAVGFGMFLYDNYYKKDGVLTETDLLEALDKYKDADKMAIVESPKNFQAQIGENYSADYFYVKAK